ncbi:glutaredoxin family protein [Mycolicibacterium sp.]|uniref:glutaredoxin family protein n=1 Tax=Mycolicibacterium sp. TaxID=2320850 RepID=UPI00355D9BC5
MWICTIKTEYGLKSEQHPNPESAIAAAEFYARNTGGLPLEWRHDRGLDRYDACLVSLNRSVAVFTVEPETPDAARGDAEPAITLYTKPGCVQCRATARQFANAGVPVKTIDVSVDTAAAALLTDLGYRSVPVVIAGSQHWSGNRPDRADAVIRQVAKQVPSCGRL